MFNKIQKIFFIFLLGCLVIYPLFVLAEETSTQPEKPVELPNPLGTTDVTAIVARIIKVVLGFVGVLALVMFIYGGLMWMTSGGKEEQIRKGKDTLVWAVAGMALVFFSYSILNFILKVLIGIKGE
jgi:hypothetical protein